MPLLYRVHCIIIIVAVVLVILIRLARALFLSLMRRSVGRLFPSALTVSLTFTLLIYGTFATFTLLFLLRFSSLRTFILLAIFFPSHCKIIEVSGRWLTSILKLQECQLMAAVSLRSSPVLPMPMVISIRPILWSLLASSIDNCLLRHCLLATLHQQRVQLAADNKTNGQQHTLC